jgi:L-ribulose-5-phosphate 3-epimerase
LEPHGKWYGTGKRGAEIIKSINHPNIRLNYDTANVMYFGGVRPEDDIESALPFMSFMHLKDDGGDFYEWNFPALGDGNIDFKSIFNLIKGYDGPISVEIEFLDMNYTMQEIDVALKKSYSFLKKFGFNL